MNLKKIGLLLSDEDDWPVAFEQLHRRLAPRLDYHGGTLSTDVERIRIHPFNLAAPTTYDLVIDRLAYWHYHPREWLKKAALVNGVYLINNPFTFQSMEKHSAYCAMIRLGLPIPDTWLIPAKQGPGHRKVPPHSQPLPRLVRPARHRPPDQLSALHEALRRRRLARRQPRGQRMGADGGL
jgi:hypothetical protein